MEFCCNCQDTDFIGSASDIAQIFSAIATFALTCYVFLYQRSQDRSSKKLQWFKELIIEPNKTIIYNFFDQVIEKSKGFNSATLTDIQKSEILTGIKSDLATFRKNFIVLLHSADSIMGEELLAHLDKLVDDITQAAFDPNQNLADAAEFELHVESKIYAAKNYLFARIFKFEG